jgi:hypothetical protein
MGRSHFYDPLSSVGIFYLYIYLFYEFIKIYVNLKVLSSPKIRNFFINFDGDNFYIKVVGFVEIYNFAVQTFSYEIFLMLN